MNRSPRSHPGFGDEIDFLELDEIIGKDFDNDEENLVMILQAIQHRYRYLPQPALTYLAGKLAIPLSRVYSVGTFYSTFSLEPKGRHVISVCRGTACHVRGATRLQEQMERLLHIDSGHTTEDGRFTLESVRCIGCCSLGPVIKINEDVHGRLNPDAVQDVLEDYE